MEALTLVVQVRCLSCGVTYTKPEGRGILKTNPGCPECGYLGWSLPGDELNEAALRRRFSGGPPLRPSAQWR